MHGAGDYTGTGRPEEGRGEPRRIQLDLRGHVIDTVLPPVRDGSGEVTLGSSCRRTSPGSVRSRSSSWWPRASPRWLPGSIVRSATIRARTRIAPDVLKRIFDPFFTTRKVGQGTGLGLPICHSIVTAHGGTIAATSRPGGGSTFRVEVPALTEDPGG